MIKEITPKQLRLQSCDLWQNQWLVLCSGDFDKKKYIERLELAKQVLKKGHKKTLIYLKEKIANHNKKLEFEKSKELHKYYLALANLFQALETTKSQSFIFRKCIFLISIFQSLLLDKVSVRKGAVWADRASVSGLLSRHDDLLPCSLLEPSRAE